jgi:hypothetical protein
MRLAQTLLMLLLLSLLLVPFRTAGQQPMNPGGQTPDTTATDERILTEVREKTDPESLLNYFRKRTFPAADPDQLDLLIRQLGDMSFKVREKAYSQLQALGSSALAALREAEGHKDAEVARRASELRQRIEEKANPAVQAAVARLLGARKPAGAAAVLINYLPFATDPMVVEEICRVLPAVAMENDKPDPTLLKSLTDKLSLKRGAAGAALALARVNAALPDVAKLLEDSEPAVRLRVGLALVQLKDKNAIPKLIDAMAHLTPEQLWPAEEILVRLAGEKAPTVSLGIDGPSRQQCFVEWNKWWEANKNGIDLTKVDLTEGNLGYTLVVQRTLTKVVGGKRIPPGYEVLEMDAQKNVRWKMEVANTSTYAVDAQVIGPDRLLVTEFSTQKIQERDFKGNLKWEKSVGGNPLSAQRLPNGHTFVVTLQRLIEFDRNGKEVFSFQSPNGELIYRARKVRNGDVVYVTSGGNLGRIDGVTRKITKTIHVGNVGSQFGSIDVLPNGNVLVPLYTNNRVLEFDPNGKIVWQAGNVQLPSSVQRLPNGNTLIGSLSTRRVVEVNRDGAEVWSWTGEGQVYNARKR